MSCNGCRILRRRCSDDCLLRPCLQWIECPGAQAHATLFVAKFFGRAGLTSFVSAVPLSRRPALFQSLLYEACGRTINPVTGAVGLLWTGNWHLCQEAVETVLRGGSLGPLPDQFNAECQLVDGSTEAAHSISAPPRVGFSSCSAAKPLRGRRRSAPVASDEDEAEAAGCDLDLCLTSQCADGGREEKRRRRLATPSVNSEGSVTTGSGGDDSAVHPRLLNLFA